MKKEDTAGVGKKSLYTRKTALRLAMGLTVLYSSAPRLSGQNDILTELLGIAERTLTEERVVLSENSRSLLKKYISAGVDRLMEQGDSETKRADARKNIAVLARQIASVVREGRSDPFGMVLEKSTGGIDPVGTAAAKVCPLYPFC